VETLPLYKLKDLEREEIEGTFYREELQKITKKMTFTELKQLLINEKKEKRKQYLIKWLGYPNKFPIYAIIRTNNRKESTVAVVAKADHGYYKSPKLLIKNLMSSMNRGLQRKV